MSFDQPRAPHPDAPGLATCYVAGCNHVAAHNHHLSYRPKCGNWGIIPLCAEHHDRLHTLHDVIRDRVPLEVFTLRYIMTPDSVEARLKGLMELPTAAPPDIDVKQLSFGDMMGPQGEYWRAIWQNEVKTPDAPKRRDRQQWRHEAA
jgi:hypothetical protein